MNDYNCFIRIHSKQHLEMKVQYPFNENIHRCGYRMDAYFFSPSQLQINNKRISIHRFLDALKIYTRFSSPMISLSRLMSPECELSPLNRINSYLDESMLEKPSEKDRILYELQTLTNMYRAQVTREVSLLRKSIQNGTPEHLYHKRIELFVEEIKQFLQCFRLFHGKFLTPEVTEQQREALRWADEKMSIITERNINRLYGYCHGMQTAEKLRKNFEEITSEETQYRRIMKYEYLYTGDDSSTGEHLAYRESILKKWSQSAMYMTSEESHTPRRIGHMLASIAAGLAMFFALIITIFAGKYFIPNSIPWILLVIISYIFKDRVKEILREVFRKNLPWMIADQLTILVDPASKRRIGRAKGIVRYGKASQAPAKVYNLRYSQPNPFRIILPEQDMLHYQRFIHLNYRKLKAHHSRLRGITEIIRIRIDDWLREMDDPHDVFYRLENGKKIKIKGNRVYFIHLVLCLKEKKDQLKEQFYHYKIVCNKRGIIRIENKGEIIHAESD